MSISQTNKQRKRRAHAKLLLFPLRKKEKQARMAFASDMVDSVVKEANAFINEPEHQEGK